MSRTGRIIYRFAAFRGWLLSRPATAYLSPASLFHPHTLVDYIATGGKSCGRLSGCPKARVSAATLETYIRLAQPPLGWGGRGAGRMTSLLLSQPTGVCFRTIGLLHELQDFVAEIQKSTITTSFA